MPEKMRARLFSRVGETRGVEFEIHGAATIGRNPENTLILEPSLVSSRHARFDYDEEQECFVLEDLDSLNGTALDGHRVSGRERLGHLHVITFAGKHDFIFQDLERCASRHEVGTEPLPQPAAPQPAAPQPAAPPREAGQREPTAVEKAPARMPSFLADPDAREPSEATDEPLPGEITGVEKALPVMPSFLADSEDKGAGEADRPSEITGVEKALPVMPGILADGGPPTDSATEDPPRFDKTEVEKLPIPMPNVLDARTSEPASEDPAGRPKETMELEDVDLPSAAELLAEDPPTDVIQLLAGQTDELTFCLEFAAPEGGFQNVELVDGENLLGRGVEARIKPDSLDISRRHALLTVTGDKVTICDLGSRNHTYLDDEELVKDVVVELELGARLRFGGVEARLIAVKGDGR